MFYKMNFLYCLKNGAETPQCDATTDVMTVRSYFCRKNMMPPWFII